MSLANTSGRVGGSPVVWTTLLCGVALLLAAQTPAAAALPDIDIDDDYANMSGNELSVDVAPGEVQVMLGEFRVVAAGPNTNIDPWDGPGTESILDLQYYDPTTDTLTRIPADGVSTPVSFWVYGGADSIEILLDGTMGDTLILDGPSKKYRLRVAEVPQDALSTTYRTQHPDQWVPGDGTVHICCRGLESGLGWLPGEVGPGIVFDPEDAELSELMDYFHLTVTVAPVICVEFEEGTIWSEFGDPGTLICDDVSVCNCGNVEVNDVHFAPGNLVGAMYGGIIPSSAVSVDPASVTIPVGECVSVELCAAVPADARSDTYVGTVYLLADGDTMFDEMEMVLTVNCVPAMDVTATLEPVVLVGGAGSKAFEVCNVGNCELSGVAGYVTGLPEAVNVTSIEVPPIIGWGDCADGVVHFEAYESLEAGTYMGTVTITADGTAPDSFPITVIMPEFLDASFAEEVIELSGSAGAVVDGSVTVENTGNADLPAYFLDLVFDDLVGDGGDVIPSELVDVDPLTAIPYGGSAEFSFHIALPDPLPDSLYAGLMGLLLAAELADVAELRLSIEASPVEGAFFASLGDADAVTLNWVVASLGSIESFNIYRAAAPGGSYFRVNEDPIPPVSPGLYEDATVWPETTFWYELRAVLLDGSEEAVGSAPVTVTTGGRLAARLHPACPNPSAQGTTLRFDVPSGGGPLALEVYSSGGKLVKSLVDHHPGRGRHTVTWDGTDLRGRHVSSGVYFARLVAGETLKTQKLIVIR